MQTIFDPEISEWGNPLRVMSQYPGLNKIDPGRQPRELKHLSTSRKRKNIDFLSSGERTGNSPNRVYVKAVTLVHTVLWDRNGSGYRPVGKLQNVMLVE